MKAGNTTRRGRARGFRTAAEFFTLTEDRQTRLHSVAHVVSRMREGASLREASKEFSIDPRTIIRLAGSAIQKQTNGRYAARKSDRLLRVLTIPTPSGTREIALRNSREASRLAEYWDAVQKYLQRGETAALGKFRGKTITDAEGKPIRLLTNPADLDRLGSAGVLSFESLYARSA
jgi:hypothetical protein